MENNTGKKFVTQGKLRENTGNFISARMWPPCPEVEQRNPSHKETKHTNEGNILALKPYGDVIRSPTLGYQLPHKRTNGPMPSNVFIQKEKSTPVLLEGSFVPSGNQREKSIVFLMHWLILEKWSLTKACLCFVFQDATVRQALLRLLKHVMPQISTNQISPFFPILSTHLCCAMTHIYDDIQLDSLSLMGMVYIFLLHVARIFSNLFLAAKGY